MLLIRIENARNSGLFSRSKHAPWDMRAPEQAGEIREWCQLVNRNFRENDRWLFAFARVEVIDRYIDARCRKLLARDKLMATLILVPRRHVYRGIENAVFLKDKARRIQRCCLVTNRVISDPDNYRYDEEIDNG